MQAACAALPFLHRAEAVREICVLGSRRGEGPWVGCVWVDNTRPGATGVMRGNGQGGRSSVGMGLRQKANMGRMVCFLKRDGTHVIHD